MGAKKMYHVKATRKVMSINGDRDNITFRSASQSGCPWIHIFLTDQLSRGVSDLELSNPSVFLS